MMWLYHGYVLYFVCLFVGCTDNSNSTNQSIDSFIESVISTVHIAGLSVVVVENSSILYQNGFGYSNPNETSLINNTIDTIFTFASISKTVTSFGVMSLFDKGLFNLDDAINDYLPFMVFNPYFPNINITIRQLLSHTSSIVDEEYFKIYPFITVEGDSNISLAQFMFDIFDLNGKYYDTETFSNTSEPGTNWVYSNIAISLSGYLAEYIINTKMINNENENEYITLNEYILNFIFEPMGVALDEIGFYLSDFSMNKTLNFAIPSVWNITQQKYLTYCLYGYPDYPDGNWRSSALNYQPLFSTFINFGLFNSTDPTHSSVRILNESTVIEMRKVQRGSNIIREQGIVWHYRYQSNGRRLFGHAGGDYGICTEAFFNPKTGVGFILLANCNWEPQIFTAFQLIEDRLLHIYDPNGIDLDIQQKNKTIQYDEYNSFYHKNIRYPQNTTNCTMPCNLPCDYPYS